MLQQAAKAMQYIISRQIELSGSTSAKDIGLMWNGDVEAVDERDRKIAVMEENMLATTAGNNEVMKMTEAAMLMLQDQMSMMRESQQLIMERLGMQTETSEPVGTETETSFPEDTQESSNVVPASA